MKKLLLILLCLPLLFSTCKKEDEEPTNTGDNWKGNNVTFGGEGSDVSGSSVQQTIDGGYIIIGVTNSFGAGGRDAYLIKTDGNGTEQWTKTFGGVNNDWGSSIQKTTDGGYIICGGGNGISNTNGDMYLIKIDGNGEEQWEKWFFSGNMTGYGRSVKQTTDGGYIIVGSHWDAIDEDVYAKLWKTDENGFPEWSQLYITGNGGNHHGYDVLQRTDGGYIIVGTRWTGTQSSGIRIIVDENGIQQSFQSGLGSTPNCIEPTADGGYIITGVSYFTATYGMMLQKRDVNGQNLWYKSFPESVGYEGYSVQQTTDGGYIITGRGEGIRLVKTDGNGEVLWSKRLGGTNVHGEGRSVQQTTDGGYIITGYISDGSFKTSGVLIKTDENGTQQW
jgi:hypothetical protein